MRWVAFVLALLLAGCTAEPERVTLDPPTGGGFAVCPPPASRGFAVSFRADSTNDAAGLGPGIHRLDARTFLWVWLDATPTLREDRVTRLNTVDVARDADGVVYVCTRVELASPLDVDSEERSEPVAVRLRAGGDLPAGPVRVIVNWAAGCQPCDPAPMGNTTATFD